MMSSAIADAFTVFRKELLELLEDRRASRGALLQTAILIAFLGVYLPSNGNTLWVRPEFMAVIFFLFPSLLAATMAADSFAGERERGTLETLLATPLSDVSLFFGKVVWAVGYSFMVSAAALACALVTTRVAYGSVERYVPGIAVAGAAGVALAATMFTSAVTVLVSARTPVTRAAMQISRVISIAVGALLLGSAHVLLTAPGWPAVFVLQAALLAAATLAIRLSAKFFRRDLLFERR